jgi:putative drug exporter of the RND superfamily
MGDTIAFQQMGFGVAVALLIDATIVRSVLVPATMTLLGEHNWYLPSWLSWLPDVRVEGAEPPRGGRPGAWSTHAAREGP